MLANKVWRRLLGVCDRTVIESVEFDEEADAVVAHVRPRSVRQARCGRCGRRGGGYDQGEGRRRWRALDLGEVRSFLEADAPRVSCPEHGPTVIQVPWARHGAGHTRAFDDTLAWLAVHTSKTVIVELLRTAWATVGAVVARVVDEARAAVDPLDGLVRIGERPSRQERGPGPGGRTPTGAVPTRRSVRQELSTIWSIRRGVPVQCCRKGAFGGPGGHDMTTDTVEPTAEPEQLGLEVPGPWVESPFFAAELGRRQLGEADRGLAIDFHRDGYVMLPGLIDTDTCERIREEVAPLCLPPFEMGRSTSRVPDAWKSSPAARALATHPRVMSLLSVLYGRRPLPFQTLHFSVGSEQRAHSDFIHFSSLPARYMCGVWVALEDIELDSGPLFYYPGSHRLPELDYQDLGLKLDGLYGPSYEAYEDLMEALMVNVGLERRQLVVSRGDCLVWSSNLVHGGSPILRAGASRWSQVTHYFFEDCIYYTPMLSNRVTGELALRNTMVDIASDKLLLHSYNGAKIIGAETSGGQFRIAIVPE